MGLFSSKKEKDKKKEAQEAKVIETPVSDLAPMQLSDDTSAYGILIGPHVTEKSALLAQNNQYVFKIRPRVNKLQIKSAVEMLYSVKVRNVQVISLPEKSRTLGKTKGSRPGFRKAIVRLQEGDKIDISAS